MVGAKKREIAVSKDNQEGIMEKAFNLNPEEKHNLNRDRWEWK